MNLTMTNSDELGQWMRDRRHHVLRSIKGPAPEGATYSDGEPIVRPVNIGWRDEETGEEFSIEYAPADTPKGEG